MNAAQRRTQISQILTDTAVPLSATALAARFSVSRQVIVGDIALLRASGLPILATPRGYMMESPAKSPETFVKSIVCTHDDDRMAEEIYTIVDLGGALLDVTVSHSVYGSLCASLHIFSRYDADLFLKKLRDAHARPLCDLTDGVHLHRICCGDEATFLRIEAALAEKGLLFPR